MWRHAFAVRAAACVSVTHNRITKPKNKENNNKNNLKIMAALGKIRSKGVLLICIISLGLFAFIAEEAFRSCESSNNDKRQQVGEVLGEKINVQDFQKLVDEYSEVIKMQQGQENLNEDQLNFCHGILHYTKFEMIYLYYFV